jgi:hypothetical protein
MPSHSIAPIPLLEAYFEQPGVIPLIFEEYHPRRGWYYTGYKKRISVAWARKLRAAGVESVGLECLGRRASFRLDELLGRERRQD